MGAKHRLICVSVYSAPGNRLHQMLSRATNVLVPLYLAHGKELPPDLGRALQKSFEAGLLGSTQQVTTPHGEIQGLLAVAQRNVPAVAVSRRLRPSLRSVQSR